MTVTCYMRDMVAAQDEDDFIIFNTWAWKFLEQLKIMILQTALSIQFGVCDFLLLQDMAVCACLVIFHCWGNGWFQNWIWRTWIMRHWRKDYMKRLLIMCEEVKYLAFCFSLIIDGALENFRS
jgi:hypothetical protein